jgi:uncharacterized protein YndB with AHSA1/START domain
MIKKIAIAVVALLVASVAGVLAYATTKPDTFHVARSANIKAPPEKIFPMINDLRSQLTWIPFDKDPAAKRSFNAVASGKGATYAWNGNSEVGEGQIEIVDAAMPSKVTMKLDMIRPFETHNTVEFTLAAKGGSTDVTWAMHGQQPLIAKVIGVFIDCDKMVGGEFEKGLAKLKSLVEKQATAAASAGAR